MDYTIRGIVFTSSVSVLSMAIVGFPLSKPQASPGLITSVLPLRYDFAT